MAVTDIKFLPQGSQIVRSGELQMSASLHGPTQFVSVSPDGYLKVYSLLCFDKDPARPDRIALIPFLTIPMTLIFPKIQNIKPVCIQF